MNDLSSNVATGGLNQDSDDNSAGVVSMSTPNKKSRSDPDEICLDAINSNNINFPTTCSCFNDPDTEEKMRSVEAVLPGGAVDAEVHLDEGPLKVMPQASCCHAVARQKTEHAGRTLCKNGP